MGFSTSCFRFRGWKFFFVFFTQHALKSRVFFENSFHLKQPMCLFDSSLHVLPLDVSVLQASCATQDGSMLQKTVLPGRIYSSHAKILTNMKNLRKLKKTFFISTEDFYGGKEIKLGRQSRQNSA